MALRWKRRPKLIGLMAIGSGPRPSDLKDGLETYAATAVHRDGPRVIGWFWTALHEPDVPYINTHDQTCETEEEAKVAAMAYVQHHRAVFAEAEKVKSVTQTTR